MDTKERKERQHEWVTEWLVGSDEPNSDWYESYCCLCFKYRDWSRDETDQGICE